MFLLPINGLNCMHMFWRIMLLFSLVMSSCASKEKREEEMLARAAARMADPVVTEIPITPTEPPRVARVPQDPIPVYKPAKIREVKMDAYVNERGEAFPPSTKYVIEDPGGWNMDALRSPQVAYVPPSSALEIPAAPGLKYTQMTQSSAIPGPAQGNPSRLLYNLKDVKITGYTEMAQESRARNMATPSEATIFDDKLGWILVPKSVLNATPGAKPRPVEKPPRLIPDADIGKGDGSRPPPRASDFDLINAAPAPPPGPRRGAHPVTLGGEDPSDSLPQMD
jgi:hypothetical protein